jgi:hypothetical protein
MARKTSAAGLHEYAKLKPVLTGMYDESKLYTALVRS